MINQGWEKESLQYGGHRRSSLLLKKKLKKIAKAKAIDQTISSSNSQAKLFKLSTQKAKIIDERSRLETQDSVHDR